LGNVNGPNSWINGKVKMNLYVATHELGHNFGTHHAATLRCYDELGTRVAYSDSCVSNEYGDPFDIMGGAGSYSATYHLNSYNRKLVGYLGSADQQTVTANGVYRVANSQAAGGTPRILRVLRPSGDYWYLEHRRPYGLFDTFAFSAPVTNGVSIRLAPSFKRIPSLLVDTRPETTTFTDAPLAAGATFRDPLGAVSITTLALDGQGATVRIQVAPDVVAPSAVAGVTAETSGDSVTLGWSAASDDLELGGYIVQRDGVEIARTSELSYTDTGLPQAVEYGYAVAAIDAAGNIGPPTTAAVYLPDSRAPSMPEALTVTQTGDRQVSLAWGAATDNIGVVGYRVERNGQPLGETAELWLDDAAVIDGWTYTYVVRGLDAAGNAGEGVGFELSLPDVTPPGAPGALPPTTPGPTATIQWTAAADNVAVAGYTLSRGGTVLATLDGTATAFSEAGLVDGSYEYEVVPFDAAGHLGPALVAVATVQTRDVTPPSVPAGLTSRSRAYRYVDISWQPSTDDRTGTIRYALFRNGTRIARLTTTSFVDRPATTGKYRYKVRAIDASGNASVFSAEVIGTAVRSIR
jgi:fibronectin type 3 domain-containing protein